MTLITGMLVKRIGGVGGAVGVEQLHECLCTTVLWLVL